MKETILRSGIDRRTLLTTLALLPTATNMTHRDLPSTERIGWNSKSRSERGVHGHSVTLPN